MDRFDVVVIGAGAAGEAAAHKAAELGARVAIVERELFGGSCPFWACVPSKALLHAAAVRACGGDYPWRRASDFRDWTTSREGRDSADDSGHVRSLEEAGALPIRGTARPDGPRLVRVALTGGGERTLEARHVVLAVGSVSKIPDIPGLAETRPWTNREATTARELPRSLVVLGGGPTGVELAQVYARFGVPVGLVESNGRLLARDEPRNGEALARALTADGVTIRTGRRTVRAHPGAGEDSAHVLELDDGSSLTGHAVLVAVGRAYPALRTVGLETVGVDPGGLPADGRLQVADGVWIAGDPAGPELHTHLAHYQGELAVRIALGEAVEPDYRAIPRATYTDPETASVGLTLEAARAAGHDALELSVELPATTRGMLSEARFGHVTIVVDRASHELLGAAIAAPDASAAIHEAVLAIRARVRLETLVETVHAFPSTSRALAGLFGDAARQLGLPGFGRSNGAG